MKRTSNKTLSLATQKTFRRPSSFFLSVFTFKMHFLSPPSTSSRFFFGCKNHKKVMANGRFFGEYHVELENICIIFSLSKAALTLKLHPKVKRNLFFFFSTFLMLLNSREACQALDPKSRPVKRNDASTMNRFCYIQTKCSLCHLFSFSVEVFRLCFRTACSSSPLSCLAVHVTSASVPCGPGFMPASVVWV